MIEISNVPIHFNSTTSPAKIIAAQVSLDSYFDLNIQSPLTDSTTDPLHGKNGDYKVDVSLYPSNYDLAQLPARALAIPVILGQVSKSDLITFYFTTAIPNYDQFDHRRPVINRLRLHATPAFVTGNNNPPLVLLSTYILVVDLSSIT